MKAEIMGQRAARRSRVYQRPDRSGLTDGCSAMSRPERAQMPSASDPVQQFRDAMAARDLIAPADLIADGTIHRCDTNDGPRGRGDGSYVLHLDGIAAGGFEAGKTGEPIRIVR